MIKTLFNRLFKMGGIPKKLRPVIESEGILVCDEGIGGWYITKNYQAPGKRYKYRMEGFSGFLAITKKRIIAYTYRKRQINISVKDPKISALHVKVVHPNRIDVSFESSVFHNDRRGIVTFRFNTEKAQSFLDVLTNFGAQQGDFLQDAEKLRHKA